MRCRQLHAALPRCVLLRPEPCQREARHFACPGSPQDPDPPQQGRPGRPQLPAAVGCVAAAGCGVMTSVRYWHKCASGSSGTVGGRRRAARSRPPSPPPLHPAPPAPAATPHRHHQVHLQGLRGADRGEGGLLCCCAGAGTLLRCRRLWGWVAQRCGHGEAAGSLPSSAAPRRTPDPSPAPASTTRRPRRRARTRAWRCAACS